MTTESIVGALLLGIIEGLTEFIPVSSTGHLLLIGHFIGFKSEGRAFEVMIQLGAIAAILTVYFTRLTRIAVALPTSAKARHFTLGVLLAFLPAAAIGALAYDFIKAVLFETPALVCVTLIFGGIIMLLVDKMPLQARYTNVEDYPLSLYIKIGFAQCMAMIPGVSRSGATIVASLLMGTDKRSAAEFSFFLAMPTMVGAFVFDFLKNKDALGQDDWTLIIIGLVSSFIAGFFVVRSLLDYVSRHGFALFGWWRIIVGGLGLLGLILTQS
ncbi:Undecaprenyl-diphosphatase [Pseudovibrio sp. W64]|uniref:undecaprenyl-diphosphate phosphatase n=1 Tax=unclassified Pseudovibrio TaxID=2627060 RepID=UPI00070D8BB9|nr:MULTISPECIES: undecaprenyl-diphosphate phosphatase [unclassified Pseudovibrio]KZK77781.1 Undecaprenyl-diphosphatase [Pseudovibrio sp. W64]KZK99925.1 Undecaprenyl-diphosphatase [Pseudovibrio sp. W74]KZL11755.1 Undecaprenyl-diphosphatase [Pseudovibrio sp. Ad14]